MWAVPRVSAPRAPRIKDLVYGWLSVAGLALTCQFGRPSSCACAERDDDVHLTAAERAAWRRLSKQLAHSSMAR